MSSITLQQLIRDQFGFVPTAEQQSLIQGLEEFTLKQGGHNVLLINGYAGTGKTSLLAAYLKTMKDIRQKTKIMAPTGRAAKVISVKAGQDAFTIHKLIYRRKSKADLGSPISLNVNLHKNTVFVVDEASMIGDYTMTKDGNVGARNLLEDLFEFVFSGAGCKLILLGDVGQLPPVGSDHSPALNKDYLDSHFPSLHLSFFSLTEVVRQSKESGILANATMLRSITSMADLKIEPTEDLIRLNGSELQEELEDAYHQVGSDETIIITRSNKRANLYNQQIRGRILWFEEELCSGDILMVVKNNYFWMGDESKMGFIANGELLTVKRIMKYEELYGFRFARILGVFVDYPDLGEQELLLLMESLEVEGPSISRARLKDLFFEVEKDYMHERNKKKRYEKILSNPYFNALQVKYAYAVTCHKSQGGQWSRVFIDQGFVPEDQRGPDYFRWLYTAITRAADRVYLVNFEEAFFS
ncbi:MAG: ATP-dependent DNA helicase [Crocinitomicaceae bacterium]